MKHLFPFLLLFIVPTMVLARPRTIRRVEPVSVSCPVGTAPVLPYQVWVTYSDGRGEWRQTRWKSP